SSDHITISNNHVTYAGIDSGPDQHMQGIFLRNTTYSTITGNITDHNSCIGIRLINNSDYNLVSNNISFANLSSIAYPVVVVSDAAGIDLTGASNNIVINNTTYSNEDSGINVYIDGNGVPSENNLIIGNITYENGDHGIDVNNSPNNTIVGNTVHGNGTVGINVEGEAGTGSHTTTIVNNISAANGFTPPAGSFPGNLRVDSASITGTTTDYNVFNIEDATSQILWDDVSYVSLAAFQAAVPTQELHGLEGNPDFVDPAPSALRQTGVPYIGSEYVGDYYLNPGSPAIDSANSNAPSQPELDFSGNARVDDPATPNTGAGTRLYDDRGAYEYLPSGPSLPTVTTQAVTSITDTTATGNGNVLATGLPNPTQHGVVWGLSADPTLLDSKTTDGPVSAPGAFTSAITDLTPGTLYHVRAYATNDAGTVYGEDVTFTSLITPTVTTQAITNITTTTATGNGNVTDLGIPNPTQHGIVWATTADPTTADNKTTDGLVSATGAFIGSITGLTPNTLYHVRAYATNAAGTSYGEDVTFTSYIVPTVTTQAVTDITTTTATGNGNVTALGVPNPTQHGFVWATTADPTTANSKTTDGPVSAAGAFTSAITGLTPGTLYHVRAYAVNTAGTVYGEDLTFTTLLAPTVTTQAVTDITTTTATGNGNITVLGSSNPTEHGVVWSLSTNPTIANNKTTDGPVSVTGAFTSSITGLIPGTLYHVRAYATNAAGISYGEDVTFTAQVVPTVTTQAVTDITPTAATGNGTITSLGVPNPTQFGVVWDTAINPTIALTTKTAQGDATITGAFTSSITGLTPSTVYHVRAYATNAAGTSYGEDVTFTSHIAPIVTTQAVIDITSTTATGNGNITALGIPNPTQFGVVWDTAINPTIALTTKTAQGEATITGAFTSSITGLTAGTLYHVRAYATNAAGTSYGENVTFTSQITPTVTTQAVTDITTTTATGNGNVTALGLPNPTEHGVVWSTSLNPTLADSKTTDGPVSATGAFISSITGLTTGTLYHVRAYATNAAGISYGEDVTFTAHIVPTVTTQAVTDITTTTATGNGNVTALGVPNPTEHGVVWSTSVNPTLADSKTTDGPVSATDAFTSNITSLSPGMLYHVRAYATNAGGTVYGSDVVFTTLPSSTSTTTSGTNAGTGTDVSGVGTASWLNPSFITANDTSYAQVTLSSATSHYLEGTNYGFDIPANAIINGIEVTIGRFESGASTGDDVRDSVVRLLKSGAVIGSNKGATSTEWPTGSPVDAVYGTTADLWGTSWTPSEINASGFGVVLSASSTNNRTAYVDYMQISVTYTVTMVSSTTRVDCGAGTPVLTYGSDLTCVATVTRGSGAYTPTGNVTWTTDGSGSFATSPCVLSGSAGTASCSAIYTPSSVGSGSHLITADYAGDLNFFSSYDNQTVTVNKADATVTLGSLLQLYDGTPKLATATTDPIGLTVNFTYDGSAVAPTAVGSYAVVGTIDDPIYQGSASGTLDIQAKHSIALVEGWNLVSFNVHPADTDVAAVLSSIDGNYDLVYAWDATVTSNNWLIYDPSISSNFNTLKELDESMGFWIHMTSAGTLDVVGSAPTSTNIQLLDNAGGWNLVAYPSISSRLLPDVLESHGVGTDFSLVYAYDASDVGSPWKLFDLSISSNFNTLTELVPGWGYWINVSADNTWDVQFLAD
ncbi:MAG: right-handed parallel beta-helix repeat-containing protein, partial [Deltaproteobacteria bacterium]|nr:right-handed parallel beta-helix repeat-containing protein [Deltaproteobacteria bacterium]